MTVIVTPSGRLPVGDVKGWPLAGLHDVGVSLGVRKSIELIGLDAVAAYSKLYRSQPWVAICVNKLARGIARLPLKTFELAANGDRARVREHPLPQLLGRPYPRGSAFRLKEAIVGSVAIYGNALVWKYRKGPGQPPAELWPIPWRYVTPVSGKTTPISHYEYNGPAGRRIFLAEDVIHFAYWSPEGENGISPLEQLAVTLQLEDAGRRSAVASFRNGNRPGGALVTAARLQEDHKQELKAEMKAVHEGPDNAFRLALLDAGLEWKPFAHTAQEAQTIEHRKLNREEVAAVYDIPPPIIGILDRATFSNVSEQHRMLYMDTLGPWLTFLEETLKASLVDEEPVYGDVFVEFDLSEVLKGDVKERSEAYQRFLQSGVYTPNDLRAIENLPRKDDPRADALYVPLNMRAIDGGENEDDLLARAERAGLAAQRLGLAINYGVLTPEEAREIVGLEELAGPAPAPEDIAPPTPAPVE